jgi:hypothetical protein
LGLFNNITSGVSWCGQLCLPRNAVMAYFNCSEKNLPRDSYQIATSNFQGQTGRTQGCAKHCKRDSTAPTGAERQAATDPLRSPEAPVLGDYVHRIEHQPIIQEKFAT